MEPEQPGTKPTQPTATTSPQGKKFLIPAVIAVVVLIGIVAVIAMTRREKDNSRNDHSAWEEQISTQRGNGDGSGQGTSQLAAADLFLAQNGQGCVKQDVTFTSPPIPESQIGFIEPMGKMNDGHVTPTDHVYSHPKNSQAPDNTYDAVMPADGTVVEVGAMPAEYIGDRNQQAAADDHRIIVMHSCRYFSIFIHVHKLDPVLSAVTGTMTPNTQKKVSIALKAGDKLGGIGSSGFDWTLVDTSTTLTGFITPSLYNGESWKIHATDPTSVYTGAMKAKMEAWSMRSSAPYGGKIDYDIKGALIGNWFKTGTSGYSGPQSSSGEGRYWDGHLAIAPDHIDPATTIVSTGNWDGKAAQFAVKGTVDPATVTTATGPVKYELTSVSYMLPSGTGWTGNETFQKGIKVSTQGATAGTILLEVQAGEKLRVEKFIGKTPAQVSGFTSAALSYER